MKNYEAMIRRNNVFNLSVTEFLLIMSFLLMIMVSYFGSEFDKEKKDSQSLSDSIQASIRALNTLSDKLGLDNIERNGKEEAAVQLSQLKDKIEEIVSFINAPIDIKEDWDRLVFIKNAIDSSGSTLEEFKKVAETRRQLEYYRSEFEKAAETRSQLEYCRSEYERISDRCGTGYPICVGTGHWLAELTLFEKDIQVKPGLNVASIQNPFQRRNYSLSEFESVSEQYYLNSQSQPIECRYQVRVLDSTKIKSTYKNYIKTIEKMFYKKEVIFLDE